MAVSLLELMKTGRKQLSPNIQNHFSQNLCDRRPFLLPVIRVFVGTLIGILLTDRYIAAGAIFLFLLLMEFISSHFMRQRLGRKKSESYVLWFTGLSGAGKSTISEAVCAELKKRGTEFEYLDGDALRAIFPDTGFERAERDKHIRRVGHIASRLERHHVPVIVSLVSPYRESRDFVRTLCKNFVEIYVATSLEECERRDVKGLYAKARNGEIQNFTGISDTYEPSLKPELKIDTAIVPLNQSVRTVLDYIERNF